MTAILDLVYQFHYLTGKCHGGQGLDIEEISELCELEAHFGVDHSSDTDLWACRRAFARVPVTLSANLRNQKLADTVPVVDLGPGGMVCHSAPYVTIGDHLEVVFDDSARRLSFRFRAEVAWVDEDGDDYAVGLEFVGSPLLVRYAPEVIETAGRATTVDGTSEAEPERRHTGSADISGTSAAIAA